MESKNGKTYEDEITISQYTDALYRKKTITRGYFIVIGNWFKKNTKTRINIFHFSYIPYKNSINLL